MKRESNGSLLVVATSLVLACSAVQAVASDHDDESNYRSVPQRIKHSTVRAAEATRHGIERGADATVRGIKRGAEGVRRGVETGAHAVSRVAHRVADKL